MASFNHTLSNIHAHSRLFQPNFLLSLQLDLTALLNYYAAMIFIHCATVATYIKCHYFSVLLLCINNFQYCFQDDPFRQLATALVQLLQEAIVTSFFSNSLHVQLRVVIECVHASLVCCIQSNESCLFYSKVYLLLYIELTIHCKQLSTPFSDNESMSSVYPNKKSTKLVK